MSEKPSLKKPATDAEKNEFSERFTRAVNEFRRVLGPGEICAFVTVLDLKTGCHATVGNLDPQQMADMLTKAVANATATRGRLNS